jgi:hemolysin III
MQEVPSVEQARRLTLGPVQNPVRGLLHGPAALASLFLCAWLWISSTCSAGMLAAVLVFAGSHFLLYSASALYHSVPWSPHWKRRMQRIDHSMIYLKIAGTLTPIVWIGLDDWRRTALLAAAWAIAAAGILQKAFLPSLPERASIPLQLLQGCLVLPALGPLAERLPGAPVILVASGACLYLLGALAFVTERPRLWPRVFSFHELFHLCVVAAGGFYSALVVQHLARWN